MGSQRSGMNPDAPDLATVRPNGQGWDAAGMGVTVLRFHRTEGLMEATPSRSRGAALAGDAPMLSVGLPSQMEVLAFKLTPLNFGAGVLSATGPTMEARLTFSGVALSWLADAGVKDAAGNALAAGSGTTVTLVGTPAAINDYLAKGALGATTTADATLGVSVAYGGGSASSGSISLKSVNPLVNVTGLGDLLDHLPNGWTSKRSDQAYPEFFPGASPTTRSAEPTTIPRKGPGG